MNSSILKKILVPAAFLILCFFTYGLLIPWLGFYWDDWPYQFFARTLGPAGFWQVFEHDRPFLSLTYSTFVPLFGPHPIVWQVFGILTRWLTVLSLWWLLNLTWPDNRRQNTWAAALFAVYPGFTQQWISVIYSQAHLLLASFILSLACMVYAFRRPRAFWPATALSLLASILSLFSTEYFFGIELLRPLFILVLLFQTGQSSWKCRLKKGFLIWLPYLSLFVAFGVWRAFFFQSSNYEVAALTDLAARPENTLFGLITSMVSNGFTAGWTAWGQTFRLPHIFDLAIRGTQLYWAIVLAAAAAVGFFLYKNTGTRQAEEPASRQFPSGWCWQALLIGLAGLLVGSLPFWIASLPFTLAFQWDRFTLALMIPAALFVTGLIDLFIHSIRQKLLILTILIAMAVGFQFQASNTYKREWAAMQGLFWQLTWRAPGLKPGTMVLTHEFPLKYYSDNSLTAVLNWIYAPENHSNSLPYILNYLTVRLNGAIPSLDYDVPVQQDYRALSFTGSTSDSLLVYYAYPGCLRIMDPLYTNGDTIPRLPDKLTAAVHLSNLSRIDTATEPAVPPADLFGPEATGSWCYYFEKVDLARQMGDWQTAAALSDEARSETPGAAEPSEWLPFIETYIMSGRIDDARALTDQAFSANPLLATGLCQTWHRSLSNLPDPAESASETIEILSRLQCDPFPFQEQP